MVFEAHGMSFPCTELLLFNYAKVNTVFHSMAPLSHIQQCFRLSLAQISATFYPLGTPAKREVSLKEQAVGQVSFPRCLSGCVFLGAGVFLPPMMSMITLSHIWAISMLKQLSWMVYARIASVCPWLHRDFIMRLPYSATCTSSSSLGACV